MAERWPLEPDVVGSNPTSPAKEDNVSQTQAVNKAIADTLEDIASRATEGPWHWWMSEEPPFDIGNEEEVSIGISTQNGADAALICILRNHLPEIIEALRAPDDKPGPEVLHV